MVCVLQLELGHNDSEGYAQIAVQDDAAYAMYADDVLALLGAIDEIDDADAGNVFMWSHSMGGIVAMRVLLESDRVKAASFWSTMTLAGFLPRLNELRIPIAVHHARDDATTPFANSRQLSDGLRDSGVANTLHSYGGGAHFFDARDRTLAADRDAEFFRKLATAAFSGPLK